MEHLDSENNDLAQQMNAAVDGVQAAPDLEAVIAAAARSRRRSRSLSLGGAAAVVALGVGGVIMVSNRDTDELPAAQPDPVVVPLTTLSPGAESPSSETDGTEPDTTESLDDEVPVSTIRLDGDQQYGRNLPDPNAPDPADQFLDQTDEIYRREMPSGFDLQMRVSRVSYGELFGIEWDLPTGSQQDCLGNPAVFIGNPTAPRQWLSSWTAQQWWPIDETNDFQVTEHYGGQNQNIIIRTDLDGIEAGVLQGDTLSDTTSFVDGVAVLELPAYDSSAFDEVFDPMLSIATQDADGALNVQTMALYSNQYGSGIPEECSPPPFPGNELPEPGRVQPSDPVSAELSIRDRHAILVDQSIEVKPEGLLTDDTGVAEARAEMEAGQYSESAAGAEYTIDDVVFTDGDTAWFEYVIVAPTGTFGPRFGQAIFNGEVWQITRQTICQDLSLAGGQCDGNERTPNLQPPIAGGVDEATAMNNYQVIYDAYTTKMDCTPISGCGDFDLTQQLPDPGEQPADADAIRSEIIELMESLYGNGALLAQLDRIDDPTGIAETVEQLTEGSYGDEVDTTLVDVDELVFTSPTTAAFRYDLRTNGYTFNSRIGFANEIDGIWKIARDTVCNDISLGQVSCDG